MGAFKVVILIIVGGYFILLLLLYLLQTRLIFFPGKLSKEYKFNGEEVWLRTNDGEQINGVFFRGDGDLVVLYFHGNAGDLSMWQTVADDFVALGHSFFIIDYRGYGKSTGKITERGLYLDGFAAYDFLINKGFDASNIVIYGRSLGSGVATEIASRRESRGLVLESPFSSLTKMAIQTFGVFLPGLYLKFRFDNLAKINNVKCPIIFIHGNNDTLIPVSHVHTLYERFSGSKKLVIIPAGAHNDLHTFEEYTLFLREDLVSFFKE